MKALELSNSSPCCDWFDSPCDFLLPVSGFSSGIPIPKGLFTITSGFKRILLIELKIFMSSSIKKLSPNWRLTPYNQIHFICRNFKIRNQNYYPDFYDS